jgi:esterase/lipase
VAAIDGESGLQSIRFTAIVAYVATQSKPVSLSADQVDELSRKLADMRHNVNNYLSLITAASEIVRRKPEVAERMMNTVDDQPQKIISEIRKFSEEFEKMLGVVPLT